MDLEAISKQVAVVITIKGRLDAIAKEEGEVLTQVANIDREIEKLEAAKKRKETAAQKLRTLTEEATGLGKLLQEKLVELERNGVILPIDKKSETVRL